ncbi:PilN domain-containing protein [Gluconobacter sp. Dm-74]|uniref:PilN domain-containing protein n=1 Tax=Gluconobacter sp. Dm-74 TaxID=2799803 RepID=UPI001B8C450E|nr:PilN domain-containing protein [Gluconobacter sp. Dm-74]
MAELLPAALRRDQRQDVRLPVRRDGTLAPNSLSRLPLPASRKKSLLSARPAPVCLVLPAGAMLARELTLPRAAVPHAVQTIGYDLDRLTPFRPEDVVWTVTPTGKSFPLRNGQVGFRLLVAPHRAFEAAMQELVQHAVIPTHLRCEGLEGALPLGTPSKVRKIRPSLLVLLGLALIAAPFIRQEISRLRLDHALSTLSAEKQQAEALRRDIAGFTQGPAAIRREEHRLGSSLLVLQTLTQALPEETFLTELHLHERHVSLEGQSAQATQLIGILEHHAAFSNAAFSGPITRSEDRRQDLFTLHADAPG